MLKKSFFEVLIATLAPVPTFVGTSYRFHEDKLSRGQAFAGA